MEPAPGTRKEGTVEAGESSSVASSKHQELSDSTDIWREGQQTTEEKSRDDEFEEFLEDLFL